MEKTAMFDVKPKAAAEYEAAIDRYISEMKRMRVQMVKRQTRIDKLQAETEALLAELKVG
ncbi:MAG: hypothetical protein HY318_04490 [Armatimonadetes bacterium]|nr:hypothetical protein [Armatimonadota bacterium]